MKILVVSHEFPPVGGGGANACYYLTKGYKKLGNDVVVITSNYRDLPEREVINGVTVIRVRSKRKKREQCSFFEMFSYVLYAIHMINELLEKQEFDICQVFFGVPSGVVGYWIKKKYRIPYIIRFGGGDIPGFQDRFRWIYILISPFLKIIWKNADALVANSEGLRQMALEFYDKKEIKIIPNGVDVGYFVPLEKSDRNEEEISILFVSRLIKRKGLQFVIPQMQNVVKECDKRVKLIVVGDGPYRKRLECLAKENNVSEHISFEGYKNKSELLKYYQNADIFILPSNKEGMPNVVLEALSCGLSIVMTPCEGAKELISDNGIVTEQKNFGYEIKKLLNNEDLMRRMAIASRKKAIKDFSWDKIVSRYIKLLYRCISN